MSIGKGAIQGDFGRAALLEIDAPVLLHAHPHCHALAKIAGADSLFQIDGHSYPLDDHHMVVVNPWQPHGYPHALRTGNSVILALYLRGTWLKQLHRNFALRAESGFFPAPCFEMSECLKRRVGDLAVALQGLASGCTGLEEALYRLVINIMEESTDWRGVPGTRRAGRGSISDYRIRRSIDFMKQRAGQGFTFEEVARDAGLSRPHFFSLFKEQTKLTPSIFCNALRMEGAYLALPSPDLELRAISTALGFAAPSHFTRFFRNNLGIPPSEYRRLIAR